MIDFTEPVQNTDYLSNISNSLAASISKQKDSIIWTALKENDINIYDLTNLSRNGRFIRQEGKNYQTFNYSGRDLLQIFDPEITCENHEFKVEVKYKKLY